MARRVKADLSAVAAAALWLPIIGRSAKSTALYKDIESGVRPLSKSEDAAWRKFFGDGPDPTVPAILPTPSEPTIAAAIMAQAKAIGDLAVELQRWKTADDRIAELETTVKRLLAAVNLPAAESEEREEPPAPRAKAG